MKLKPEYVGAYFKAAPSIYQSCIYFIGRERRNSSGMYLWNFEACLTVLFAVKVCRSMGMSIRYEIALRACRAALII